MHHSALTHIFTLAEMSAKYHFGVVFHTLTRHIPKNYSIVSSIFGFFFFFEKTFFSSDRCFYPLKKHNYEHFFAFDRKLIIRKSVYFRRYLFVFYFYVLFLFFAAVHRH